PDLQVAPRGGRQGDAKAEQEGRHECAGDDAGPPGGLPRRRVRRGGGPGALAAVPALQPAQPVGQAPRAAGRPQTAVPPVVPRKPEGNPMTTEVPRVVVKPGEGRSVWLGGMGAVFKVSGADTGGAFAVVEHPIEPGRLVLPHVHRHEDEYSYVLEGT